MPTFMEHVCLGAPSSEILAWTTCSYSAACGVCQGWQWLVDMELLTLPSHMQKYHHLEGHMQEMEAMLRK